MTGAEWFEQARSCFAAKDAAGGLAALEQAAEAGHGPAMVHLANRRWAADPVGAEGLLRRAAEAGDGLAMLNLGQRLIEGLGLAQDPATGEAWLERAADTGFAPAMGAWGERLGEAGRAWLERAAEAGHAPAMTALAERGGPEAGAWLERAVARGHGRAMGLLGEVRLADDPAEGRRLLREAFRRGELHFGLVLGVHDYQAGRFEAAAEVFAAALKQGSPSAAINAACMARRGEWPATLALPSVEALLGELAGEGEPWAIVNLALHRHAKGEPVEALLAGLPRGEALAPLEAWWRGVEEPERGVVLGWLQASPGFKPLDGA